MSTYLIIGAIAVLIITLLMARPAIRLALSIDKGLLLRFDLGFPRIGILFLTITLERIEAGEYQIQLKGMRGQVKKQWRLEQIIAKLRKPDMNKPPVKPFIQRLLQRASLKQVGLSAIMGISSAADITALLCGWVTIAVNMALNRLYTRQGLPAKANVKVEPDFYHTDFRLRFECIFNISLAYIIIAGTRYAVQRARKKGPKCRG
jgi:hypothetical protein